MAFHGVSAEIWHGIDAQSYVDELREEWEQISPKPSSKSLRDEQLTRECKVLTNLTFDDIGTANEWLLIENEALLRSVDGDEDLMIP